LPNVRKQNFVDQRPDSPSSKKIRVIAEVDDGRATIDDVIQIAGVTRGTFYNYFTDRNALLDAVWQGSGRDPFLGMQQACAEVEDPAARLFIMMQLILNRTAEDATWGWLVFAMSGGTDTVNDDLARFPRPDLLEGKRTGTFTFENLDSASDLIAVGASCRNERNFNRRSERFLSPVDLHSVGEGAWLDRHRSPPAIHPSAAQSRVTPHRNQARSNIPIAKRSNHPDQPNCVRGADREVQTRLQHSSSLLFLVTPFGWHSALAAVQFAFS
jgi:AcrR family transcriptional regulator